MNLKDKKLFLMDMDGTIYLGDNLFDCTPAFLEYIKSIGGKAIYITNNSAKSTADYVKKLSTLGIDASEEDFYTSAAATEKYLADNAYKKIYVAGTESLKKYFRSCGLNITDELEEGIDCLCMGNDTELTFKKLDDACRLLKNDIGYVATNPDWVCPTEYGYVPDCGSVCDMLYRATGKKPVFIGKPQPDMILAAISQSGFSKEDAIVFGDRLYTDIASGYNAGVTTAFVLSGEGTLADVEESPVKPDYIFKDLTEFLNNVAERNESEL